MDWLESSIKHIENDGLNFNEIVELFGSRTDIDEITKWLKVLYFDYTRLLFVINDRDKLPLPEEIEQELYWLRQILEAIEAMKEPNRRIRIKFELIN